MELENVRLHIDHLRVGVPLPFDVYDSHGHTLLRCNFVIPDQQQLDRLIERGAFCSAAAAEEWERTHGPNAALLAHVPHAAHRVVEKVSVFGLLARARQQLEGLPRSADPAAAGAVNMGAAVAEMVRIVQQACTLDADAALGSIQVVKPHRLWVHQAVSVAILAELLLRQVGADEAERGATLAAALTMNLTITDLPFALVHEQDRLNPEHLQREREHPRRAADLLRAQRVTDQLWLQAVEQHHEAFDGSGYPAGLAGAQICRAAQVLALADRYCAMVADRGPKPGAYPNVALREIFIKHGRAIDPMLAASLIRELGIYPPGAVVMLVSGELGVVVKRTLNSHHPVVRSLFTPNGKKYPSPPKRLTSKPVYDIKGVAHRDKVADFDLQSLWSLAEVEAGEAQQAGE